MVLLIWVGMVCVFTFSRGVCLGYFVDGVSG